MSAEALKLKLAIANLQKQHRLVAPPFTPLPLGPVVAYDITREGYCAPATIDREFTKFAATCWTPFKPDIPVLYRHQPDKQAGRLEDIRVDKNGLWVRARVLHSEAKRAPYWSVCATIHSWQIIQAGAQACGLITSATLDEVSLVPLDPLKQVRVGLGFRWGGRAGNQNDVEPTRRLLERQIGNKPYAVRGAQRIAVGGNEYGFIAVGTVEESVRLAEHVQRPGHVQGLDPLVDDDRDGLYRHLCCLSTQAPYYACRSRDEKAGW
jgi:hypothetical protein